VVSSGSPREILTEDLASVDAESEVDAEVHEAFVRSPATPHPDAIVPPPPPGEPPWLPKNKRPHDPMRRERVEDPPDQVMSCPAPMRAMPSSSTLKMAMVASLSGSCPSSPASASSSTSEGGSADMEEGVCTNLAEDGDEVQFMMVAAPSRPTTPPGPPPTMMAPPPPSGPPPSLPIERAELKRGAARLYPDEEPGASDGDSHKRLRSCTVPVAPGDHAEESYAKAPPSARWVWDHILQQDNSAESAAVLEKRALQALGTLRVGTGSPEPEQQDSDEPDRPM